MAPFRVVLRLLYVSKDLLSEGLHMLRLMACARASLAAEVLFLRKQLAFYQEREIKPRRFDDAARLSMLLLSKFFDWKNALIQREAGYFHRLGIRKPFGSCGGGSHAVEDQGSPGTFDS
jgi:hypothetical protein